MKNSKIEWCHHTVNFWWGCVFALLTDGAVRQECIHCYALKLSKFFSKGKATWGTDGKRWLRMIVAGKELHKLAKAAQKAGERHRVFINSMSDTFEDRRDLDEVREYMWTRFEEVGYALDILLLTKRPENVMRMVPKGWADNWPAHVWIGATAGTQAAADQALPVLSDIPAKVRFVSMEPLLEEVNIEDYLEDQCDGGYVLGSAPLHWVIVGGESGPGARPMHPDWARSLRDQCKAAGVPFFFKQWGEWGRRGENSLTLDSVDTIERRGFWRDGREWSLGITTEKTEHMVRVGKKAAGRLLDGQEHSEFPEVAP